MFGLESDDYLFKLRVPAECEQQVAGALQSAGVLFGRMYERSLDIASVFAIASFGATGIDALLHVIEFAKARARNLREGSSEEGLNRARKIPARVTMHRRDGTAIDVEGESPAEVREILVAALALSEATSTDEWTSCRPKEEP